MSEWTIRIRVEIDDEIPAGKVREWANYVTGYTKFLPANNPLKDTDLEAVSCWVER